MITNKVRRFIESRHLFDLNDKLLVGVSGGADSVALLRVLLSLGYNCVVAHCNFHLRGEESQRDETFVRTLCHSHHIPLHVAHFDTGLVAKRSDLSVEMAARALRYAWFEETRVLLGCKVVAVAHHMDDNVETLLLNLIRKTGIAGLTGMRSRNGRIVRPLLCVSRAEVMKYLSRIGQPFVNDSTNLLPFCTRNKIRLKLIPLLEELNPDIKHGLSQTINHLNGVADIYSQYIQQAIQRVRCVEGIRINALLKETAPEAVLFEILHPLGFSPARINDIYRALTEQSGKRFLSRDWIAVKDRDTLILAEASTQENNTPPFRLERTDKPYTAEFEIPHDSHTACFDADKLLERLSCRKWAQGDTFVPLGMTGKKKVSDYMTDHKFSLLQKETQYVLCCGECIAWLVGQRIDNRFKVDNRTKTVAVFTMVYE